MSSLVEFLLIALLLYAWESTLWLPLRGIALRRRMGGGGWRVLDPGHWFRMRDSGLVPLMPLPPDLRLAPCQAPPLIRGSCGSWLLEGGPGLWIALDPPAWEDLADRPPRLCIAGTTTRLSSPRWIGVLRRAKRRGAGLDEAVDRTWRLALNPTRAAREWRKWRMVSGGLRWNGTALVLGFFAGLPLAYIHLGGPHTVALAAGLWLLMARAACHLWWLGGRVYPDARAALRMDALLALLVPFHAMRALEAAAPHAMGMTHPVALLLATRDLENPWLARFVRRVLHPATREDAVFSSAIRDSLESHLARCGRAPADYDTPPASHGGADENRYCPRCHEVYLADVPICRDCRGIRLRDFGG